MANSMVAASVIERFRGNWWFLSNFYPVTVLYAGESYLTAEHAYQAAKTIDRTGHDAIRDAPTAGTAKKMGATVTLRDRWNVLRIPIMLQIVRAKFSDPRMRRLLLSTADYELVEGNHWHDTFWGVDAVSGKGANVLGRILMQVRAEVSVINEEGEE